MKNFKMNKEFFKRIILNAMDILGYDQKMIAIVENDEDFGSESFSIHIKSAPEYAISKLEDNDTWYYSIRVDYPGTYNEPPSHDWIESKPTYDSPLECLVELTNTLMRDRVNYLYEKYHEMEADEAQSKIENHEY